MKKILLYLLPLFAGLWVQAQTLDHKLTPFLYLGAPKNELIKFATTHARLIYEDNLQNVIEDQRKNGVKLKKKDALERFLNAMEEDIVSQLKKADHWNADKVDLRKYFLNIETLMAAGVELKGFDEFGTSSLASATIYFDDGEVTSIYYSREVTSVLNPKRMTPYNDQNILQVRDIMKEHYGACGGRTVEGKTDWNSDHHNYFSRDDYYKCEEIVETIFGDYKILLDVNIRYQPYGNESNNRYYYKGTCLSSISFHLRYN